MEQIGYLPGSRRMDGSLVTSAVEGGKGIFSSLKRKYDYVKNIKENFDKLEKEEAYLLDEDADVKTELERNRATEEKTKRCETWLNEVENVKMKIEKLKNEYGNTRKYMCGLYPSPGLLKLGKLIVRTTEEVVELTNQIDKYCEQKQLVSPVATPTDVEFGALSKNFHVSKSSKKALDLIRYALLHENVSVIELWGMSGVGKTTLVLELGKELEKHRYFDKVVVATISGNPNFEIIQDDIARQLSFNMKDEQGRRRKTRDLWLRLRRERKILIILDDVWTDIDLKIKIGIPVGENPEACKIVLTTRRHRVCTSMNCSSTIIKLDCLDHQEALELFEKKAELQNCNNEEIKKLAVEIVKECQGLPIALVTLGSALKGEEHIYSWEAAYRRLKEHHLPNMEGIIDTEEGNNAYLCLATSFDLLKSKETKIIFLLCSLFPEDCEIYVEDLVRYAWGLKLYKGFDTIRKVRSNVLAAIDTLKNSCLLLDAKERHVKVYNLVRDVALWISTSNYQDISFKIKSEVIERWPTDDLQSYTAISLKTANMEVELPDEMAFPNLEILRLHGERYWSASIPNKFFEGMQTLKVCSLHENVLSLHTFEHLQSNLRSLHLKYCMLRWEILPKDILVLEKLKKLEILSFNQCDIFELPNEICELDNLRMLDLSNCKDLEIIPRHWLSRLSRLEELHLGGCRKIRWANDNATEQYYCASLSELSSLSGSIKVLSLEISPNDVPKNFVFPELEWFDIRIVQGYSFVYGQFENCVLSRSLKVKGSSIHVWKNLLKGLTSLVISCDEMQVLFPIKEVDSTNSSPDVGSSELRSIKDDHVSLQNLKVLEIVRCPKLTYIFSASMAKSLGRLETLKISDCMELEMIIQKTEASNICLQSLQEVKVERCHKLTSLDSLCHGQFLENLKELEINYCDGLEYTFPTSMYERLPQLNTFTLSRSPKLRGNDILFSLSSLQELRVFHWALLTPFIISAKVQVLCLNEIAESENNMNIKSSDMKSLTIANLVHHLFDSTYNLSMLRELKLERLRELQVIWKDPIQPHNFECLAELEIWECPRLRHVFSKAIAHNLQQLRSLEIKDCMELEEIMEKGETSDSEQPIGFPNLTEIGIGGCPKLKSVFPITVAFGLPKLQQLRIWHCNSNLEQVFEDVNLLNQRTKKYACLS